MPGNPLSIALGGDLVVRAPLAELAGTQTPGYAAIFDTLRGADLRVVNLETPLSTRGTRLPKWSNIRADPSLADEVRAMGFELVSLANNHMMDWGVVALRDTLEHLDRVGIGYAGTGENLASALAPVRREVAGRLVSLVSVASTLPPGSAAAEDLPGIAPIRVSYSFAVDGNLMDEQPGTAPLVETRANESDVARVLAVVEGERRECDIVLVAIHWGVPPYWLPPYAGELVDYQIPLGHQLVEAGADIVIGHHAHALHGIEIYRGRPILYSLGNFFFHPLRPFMDPRAVIALVEFDERGPAALRLVPTVADAVGVPAIARGEEGAGVLRFLGDLSTRFGTALTTEGDEARIDLRAGRETAAVGRV